MLWWVRNGPREAPPDSIGAQVHARYQNPSHDPRELVRSQPSAATITLRPRCVRGGAMEEVVVVPSSPSPGVPARSAWVLCRARVGWAGGGRSRRAGRRSPCRRPASERHDSRSSSAQTSRTQRNHAPPCAGPWGQGRSSRRGADSLLPGAPAPPSPSFPCQRRDLQPWGLAAGRPHPSDSAWARRPARTRVSGTSGAFVAILGTPLSLSYCHNLWSRRFGKGLSFVGILESRPPS